MQQDQTQQPDSNATDAESKLIAWGEKKFKEFSTGRIAEEREWYQAALFDQLKQWLTLRDGRYYPVQQNPAKPVPMPVSNYFSKTISDNANRLGAKMPEFICQSDGSFENRRKAQYAEAALEEADKESGADVLNPFVARHDVLWGLGCLKDYIDRSEGGFDEVPDIEAVDNESQVCQDCGAQVEPGPQPPVCPQCGSSNVVPEQTSEPQLGDVTQFPKGKLKTALVSPFEIYVSRDCIDPNLSKTKIHRFRKGKEEAKTIFGDKSKDLQADSGQSVAPQYYIDSLRSLNASTSYARGGESVSFTEIWAQWNELPDDVQKATLTLVQDQAAAQEHGIYFTYAGGKMMACGENTLEGNDPYTFFKWQVDCANPYPKGQAVELIPLQKQLNRLDAKIELEAMVNGGKWLVPATQVGTFKLSGSPYDIAWYDSIGDGKTKPEWVDGLAISPALVQRRLQIINDFRELGLTNGVASGSNPAGGVNSFRGIAYLGAKAEEAIQTQRFLWEQAHQLRKEKQLILIQRCWDEPRKIKVAGFNGKFGAAMMSAEDITGEYDIKVVKDSSRPKTLEEKMQTVQLLAQGGVIDMADFQNREWIMDTLNANELNMMDHLQVQKAERDLEMLKQGQIPAPNPNVKWDVPIRLMSEYTLTEEFEELDPQLQQMIQEYVQNMRNEQAVANATALPGPPGVDPNAAVAGAIGNSGMNNQGPMSGVPGQTVSPEASEKGAQQEGNKVPAMAGQGA